MHLSQYLKTTGQTYEQFADKVGVTRRAVQKWVTQERFPRPVQMAKIIEHTDGEVTFSDFTPKSAQDNASKSQGAA